MKYTIHLDQDHDKASKTNGLYRILVKRDGVIVAATEYGTSAAKSMLIDKAKEIIRELEKQNEVL